jgi:hypothetical protein
LVGYVIHIPVGKLKGGDEKLGRNKKVKEKWTLKKQCERV